MRQAHSVEQVRAAEADLLATLPDGALMARAASGLATAVIDLLGGAYGRRVLLLVGSGDNGGDTLFAGALLARRGAQVTAVLLADHPHAAGLAALRASGGTTCPAAGFTPPAGLDVVVDGIVGIGGRPGLRPDAVAVLSRLTGLPMVAVDVPSGLSVDTGEIDGAHVRADLTVTFGTHKPCHVLYPAALHCGAVVVVDLGLDLPEPVLEVLQPADVAALLPVPAPAAHKYTRGVVGLRTGAAYPGAGLLSAAGANCGLAGMVRHVGPDEVGNQVRAAHPEVVLGPGRVQAWVVGSGGGEDAGTELATALADGVPVVVDADALAHVRPTPGAPADPPLVLTPHAGELARMLDMRRDQVEARPWHFARHAAREFGAVVLLKGRRTVVCDPDGRTRVTTTGTPWLGTAGAGDVLAGLIGALAAAGLGPYDAASVGSWLHGAAATRASADGPIVATDVARALPGVVRDLRGQAQ
ncbi:NAD(P)H-hydrate dehydratase [Nocardioides sp. AE5]|uniref:NAD(P)H-hydrate dehydratase n=1 Tax=Nocardioides sp. AE5 TaxID=2962573 RepID=UPI002881F830|nr:NAD(P)H-hydrate dehydratase [Nocardioides sp. AE5]MDT0202059.1 NAD(P)H-hydrate dehydratase [Nocardioides sp. AE5]